MALGTSPANALAAAERIFLGRYVIDAPLPWNGLAFMFRAVEPGRVVAVAALPGDVSEDAQAAKRFRRRAAELAELRHPALLPITEAGVEQGVPYLEMEFADGRPLQDVVDEEGPLGRERAFRIADAVLDLLEVAHDARWLHWDLTPANVLLVPDPAGERVVVLGLGFRALLPGKPRPGGSGPLADRFVAPEVAAGRGDGRSDLYSVGALLYFMVTGARPPRPNGGARRAGWARPVVERALAGRSVDRFADARSMRATLRKAYEGQTVPVPRRRMRSGPLLWVAAGALCLAVGGGSALLWMRLGQNPTSARTHTLASQHPSERSEPGAERSEGPRGARGRPLEEGGGVGGSAEIKPGSASPEARRRRPAGSPHPSERSEPGTERSEGPRGARGHPLEEGGGVGGSAEIGSEARAPSPPHLQHLQERIERGDPLSRQDLAPLQAYARAHPNDPTGHLLLAHAFTDLEWHSAAIERYVQAYQADAAAAEDPRVLENLMALLPHPELHAPAARAIGLLYGSAAVEPLERFLSEADLPWVEHRRVLEFLERLKTRRKRER